MLKITPSQARLYIQNGWNTKNRRLLNKKVGEGECKMLYDAFCRIQEHGNAIPSLVGENGQLCFNAFVPKLINSHKKLVMLVKVSIENIKSSAKKPLKFIDKDINLLNIDNTLRNFESAARKI